MPTIVTREKVLDGRAEVISYERNPSHFYLRTYVSEKRTYRTRRIEEVSTLTEAKARALDVLLEIGTSSTSAETSQRRGTKEGTKLPPRKNLIKDWVTTFLYEQSELVDNGY